MSETPLWTGTSSQVKHFWLYVACVLIVPIPWAIAAWLQTRNRVFSLTTERLLIRSGVFSKTTDSLELYRVRDLRITEPFWLRLFGLKNVVLITNDSTSPEVIVDYIPASANLPEQLREQIEACRQKKGVREFGIDVEHPGDHAGGTDVS